KLLTVLAVNSARVTEMPKSKTIALTSPTPAISIPLSPKKPKVKVKVEKQDTAVTEVPPAATPIAVEQVPFDWSKVLGRIQSSDIALFSVLSKCAADLSKTTLTIYTGNSFY